MTSPTNKSINIIYKRKLDDMTSPTNKTIYINENQMIWPRQQTKQYYL